MLSARTLALAVVSALAATLSAQDPKATPSQPAPIVHAPYPTGQTTPLGTQISTLLADPKVSRAHWGIAVTELDGTPIYGLDEGKLFRPASNAKLFTSVTAMQMLGPQRTFVTTVLGRGTMDGGVLHGDLVLRGGGDANLAAGYVLPYAPKSQRPPDAKAVGLADFDDLAAQVAAKGIREIDGDIVGDDTRFENVPYPAGWAIEDMLWGYGAPVSALAIHDNQLDLTITPAPAGHQSKDTITLEPAVPFYTVNAEPGDGQTTLGVWNDDFGKNQVSEEREPYARDFQIVGDVAAKYGPYTDELAIDRPAEFAAAALKQALEQKGITVKGSTHAQHYGSGSVGSFSKAAHATPAFVEMYKVQQDHTHSVLFTPAYHEECQAQRVAGPPEPEKHVLAQKTSVPLLEDLTLTLKESQNLHAEIMLRNLGVETDCTSGSLLSTALSWERAFLTIKAGLDGQDFELYDGSGLSTKDLVTPRSVAQLLKYAAAQPWFPAWKAALPVGGEDGTLRSRFAAAALKDHVFAKTGTLGESRALSGYLDCKSGKQVIFSVIVDNHTPLTSDDRVAMDKIVAAIAASN